MTEPNETPDEQTQETPLEAPVEPSEPTEAPAEGEEPGEQGDAAETPPEEPAPGTPAGSVGDKELEKMFKRVETANASYAKRLGDIMGEEATVLQECPLCAAPFLGFIFPPAMKPVSAEVKAAVLTAVGEEVSQVSERDRYARQCASCKGMGQTLSGSRTNRDRTLTCYDCQGRGWIPVGPERQGSTGATPLAVASNGPGEPLAQPPDADPMGRPPDHPEYGMMPGFSKLPIPNMRQ